MPDYIDSLAGLQQAENAYWVGQYSEASNRFREKWNHIQSNLNTFQRLGEVGELLYARLNELTEDGKFLLLSIANFMVTHGGAFGYGVDDRGLNIMAAVMAEELPENAPEPKKEYLDPITPQNVPALP